MISPDEILQELIKLPEPDRTVVVTFLKRVTVPNGPFHTRVQAMIALIEEIDREDPTPPAAKPTVTREEMKTRVSLVRRDRSHEPETPMGTLSQGGTPPEEFWSRPDPDAAALGRRPMRGGRRLPVTR